jgi:hypothetical protein
MPPTLGGTRIRRSLTALVSALAVLMLTLVGALPNATRSSAATATTRTAQIAAKANAYTDRKHATTSHTNVRTTKVSRSRYTSYFTFAAAPLAATEAFSSATLTLRIKKASHPSQGKLVVRAVTSGWTDGKVTYQSQPRVSSFLGTAKLKKSGTVTITLNAAAASKYLVAGASLRIERTGSKHLVTLNRGPAVLNLSVADAATVEEAKARSGNSGNTTSGAKVSGKPVFALYFPPYPLSLHNETAATDYYNINYLVASGENGKWAKYGGLLRDRPIPRDPLPGDFQYTDMKTEVQQAINAGLNGFTACVLTTDTADRNFYLVDKLMKASSALSSSFKVMLMPDMTAMPNISADALAKGMSVLAQNDSVYRLSTGEVLIAPFFAEGRTPSFYADMISLMKSKYGVSAALMPIFLDANNMSSFNSVSVAFANWGIRDANIASNTAYWPNWADKAHALGKPWMEPVSVQDERPNQEIYDEASNTETMRATWKRATDQGADLVMLTTWNDYSESTSFAPSLDHGYAFLTVNKYFLTKYRTGSYPAVTKDKIVISHRIQNYAALPTSYTAVMKLRPGSGQTRPRDTVEVVTLLTAPANVTVNIGGQDHTYAAPAGFNAALFSLAEGYFTATATRSGSQVATVTTKDAVKFSTTQQDLSYHAVESN